MALFTTWVYASIAYGIKFTRNVPVYSSRIEAILITITLGIVLSGCIAFGFDYLGIDLRHSPRPTFFYLYTLLILLEIVIVFFVKSKFSPEAWNKKGIALEDLNKSEEAHQAFEKAIALKPDYATAWNNKGVALQNLNKSEEAQQAFEKAIALKPDSAQPWYNKARNYALKGNTKDALYDLEKAIKCDLSSKERAKKDEAFKELWNGKDFKRITD
jgi:tetratricopeptide (TPR) repeat protein